jgi:hypothetical protein
MEAGVIGPPFWVGHDNSIGREVARSEFSGPRRDDFGAPAGFATLKKIAHGSVQKYGARCGSRAPCPSIEDGFCAVLILYLVLGYLADVVLTGGQLDPNVVSQHSSE